MPVSSFPPPKDIFDDDDDDGWQDMPVIREDTSASGLDEEDIKKYHYQPPAKSSNVSGNATGNLIDVDDYGNEWRSKVDQNESEYTRLRINEEADADEVHLRTKYLFDEDKAMTPLSQMQATKNLLTEAQRIAYVGLCALTSREMAQSLKTVHRKEFKASISSMELWALKIMGRLYYHMELETQEQKMIESLGEHGVLAEDLVPALMTTHTVANPEYDPEEAQRLEEESRLRSGPDTLDDEDDDDDEALGSKNHDTVSISGQTLVDEPHSPRPQAPSPDPSKTPTLPSFPGQTLIVPEAIDGRSDNAPPHLKQVQTTAKVLKDSSTTAIPGVSTSLSAADKDVTLDIRWTVLCDLFLILIADSVYDARSRVLLEQVALKLGLGWLDVVKFESRVTEALEIQEDIETLEQKEIVEGARKAGTKRRYMMLGLATLGGGLVIGLSAGLLAPVIGLGLAGALTTVGVTGTGTFLAGTAGAAVITTGGVLTGSGIAARGMAKRTQQVRTFDILPLHNNKRVSCILTVPGFMAGMNDDVRLPFSVLDPIVGDVFSVLWEPEMIRETGSALKILTGEVLSQLGMTVLQATVMTGLVSAIQWPIILTKLGYLIDNPWSNALDRAKAAGRVLADVLIRRHLGVRPITLIGFSLGARVIFYALLELAKQKAFGIVQDVFLLGATLSVSTSLWCESRSVVSGRYVNAFARGDWVLNYLFRATAGGVGTVAGLRPVEGVPGLENVDVTDKIAGHMSYRTFMPLILDQLGFPVLSDFFDEPEEPDFTEDRIVVRDGEEPANSGWFGRKKNAQRSSVVPPPGPSNYIQPSAARAGPSANASPSKATSAHPPSAHDDHDDLPPRLGSSPASSTHTLPGDASQSGKKTPTPSRPSTPSNKEPATSPSDSSSHLPIHAGFDLSALKDAVRDVEDSGGKAKASSTSSLGLGKPSLPSHLAPQERSQSTPPGYAQHQRSNSVELEYTPSLDNRGPRTAGFSPPSVSAFSNGGFTSGFSRSVSEHRTPSSLSFSSFGSQDDDEDYSQPTPRPLGGSSRTGGGISMGLPETIVPSWGSASSSSQSNTSSSSSSGHTRSAFASAETGPVWGSSSHSTFGSPFSSSTSPHTNTSIYTLPSPSSSMLNNPFATSSTSNFNSTPSFATHAGPGGLSFGGPNGDIIHGDTATGSRVGSGSDSWTVPPLGSQKKPTLDNWSSNPWS